ncbi:FkbM family methyltransferase [Mucisphaera sp.]|uniref:FkbM family methyltransferase n=1 Tax=Mucisphaera sp. TaxID=2913024 RepID=UPI003D11801F
MPKLLRTLLRKTAHRKDGNLISLDDPYQIIPQLLSQTSVTGILDIGASDGRISRRLLKLFPQAHSWGFEPNVKFNDQLDLLQTEPNSRFTPVQAALSDTAGNATLHLAQNPGQTSLFRPTEERLSESPMVGELPVKAFRLDDWWEEKNKPEIQLLKLDIQGGEAAALRGGQKLLRSTARLVYTEVFFNPLYRDAAVFSDIDQALRQAGFLLYNIYKIGTLSPDRLRHANVIYTRDLPL